MSNPEIVLFDQPLELGEPLSRLWRTSARHQALEEALLAGPVASGTPLIQHYTASELGVENTEETRTRLETATEHLTKLQNLGMCVVSYAMEQRSGLRSGRTHGRDTVVAFTATPFVEGTHPLNRAGRHAVAEDKAELLITDPLHAYLEWCEETRQQDILADVYSARQYSIQHVSGIVFLHDVAPLMFDVASETDGGAETYEHLHHAVSLISKL